MRPKISKTLVRFLFSCFQLLLRRNVNLIALCPERSPKNLNLDAMRALPRLVGLHLRISQFDTSIFTMIPKRNPFTTAHMGVLRVRKPSFGFTMWVSSGLLTTSKIQRGEFIQVSISSTLCFYVIQMWLRLSRETKQSAETVMFWSLLRPQN